MGLKVLFYSSSSGKVYVEEFLDSLPSKQAQKVTWVLSLLEDLDVVPKQYFKRLEGTEEIWEVRISFGSDAFRILGFFDDPDFVVLTQGFKKKSKKVSRKEISLAEERRREYFARRRKK